MRSPSARHRKKACAPVNRARRARRSIRRRDRRAPRRALRHRRRVRKRNIDSASSPPRSPARRAPRRGDQPEGLPGRPPRRRVARPVDSRSGGPQPNHLVHVDAPATRWPPQNGARCPSGDELDGAARDPPRRARPAMSSSRPPPKTRGAVRRSRPSANRSDAGRLPIDAHAPGPRTPSSKDCRAAELVRPALELARCGFTDEVATRRRRRGGASAREAVARAYHAGPPASKSRTTALWCESTSPRRWSPAGYQTAATAACTGAPLRATVRRRAGRSRGDDVHLQRDESETPAAQRQPRASFRAHGRPDGGAPAFNTGEGVLRKRCPREPRFASVVRRRAPRAGSWRPGAHGVVAPVAAGRPRRVLRRAASRAAVPSAPSLDLRAPRLVAVLPSLTRRRRRPLGPADARRAPGEHLSSRSPGRQRRPPDRPPTIRARGG